MRDVDADPGPVDAGRRQVADEPIETTTEGVPAGQLSDDDLLRELRGVHRTRNDSLRHGSDQAMTRHGERMSELEDEYLRRFPDREVDPERLREGARARNSS
jgi:Family of unknown function (DUF6158)